MVDGVYLVHGMIVQYLVGVQTKVELVRVTVRLPNMVVMIVRLTGRLILKPKDATKIRVQEYQVDSIKKIKKVCFICVSKPFLISGILSYS